MSVKRVVNSPITLTINCHLIDEFYKFQLPLQGPPRRTPPPPYHHQQQQQSSASQHSTSHNSLNCSALSIHANNSSNSHHSNQNVSITTLSNSINSNNNHLNNSSSNNNNNNNNSAVILPNSTSVKSMIVRYNRRNNPELEKRRIHHCDFLGKSLLYIVRLIPILIIWCLWKHFKILFDSLSANDCLLSFDVEHFSRLFFLNVIRVPTYIVLLLSG